jgi:spermidine/putrescine transport system ATP-binding protein
LAAVAQGEDMTEQAPALEVVDALHRYGDVTALDHVSLTVQQGEFLTILGPSGSGKTTLLRIVGGFEMPTSVETLKIAGVDVRGLPPNHREVATVFQHYALFPHMTVGQNIEYGLKVRGVLAASRKERAEDVLRLVRLSGKYGRGIHQLSGGERQRVAFARALVTEPRILLLDEPMGALDEKLRGEMQIEIRALQQQLKTTFIQVTHSQEEALTMSDRIVVMNRGRIEQLGTPEDIFDRPATRFVAAFMGMSNLFDGKVSAIEGSFVAADCGGQTLYGRWTGKTAPVVGESVFAAVHPENLRVGPGGEAAELWNLFDGRVRSSIYKGAYTELIADTAIGPMTAAVPAADVTGAQQAVFGFSAADCAIGQAG